MKRSLLLPLLSLCILGLPAGPARAGYDEDIKAVDALVRQNRALHDTNPEQAVTVYRTYLEAHPDMDGHVALSLVGLITWVLDSRMKQPDKALQMCDWAIEAYKGHRRVVQPMAAKARILTAQKRPAEAQELLEKHWDQVMAGDREQVGPAVQQYVAALDAQGKRKEATEAVRKALSGNGDLLGYVWYSGQPLGWMYDRVIKDLIAKNRVDEALGWGKLFFMLCSPKPNEIEAATACLGRVWMIKEMSDHSLKAFKEAQLDPAKPNPLTGVKLPELDTEALDAHAAREVRVLPDVSGIVSAMVATGRLREAVVTAKQWDPRYPADAKGADLKRILKAVYLNTKVMDDYDNFAKTGQGPDPLDALAKKLAEEGEKKPEAEDKPAGEKKPAEGAGEKPAANAQTLGYVRESADDKRSLPGTGFAVSFDLPDTAGRVVKVRIYATRTGTKAPAAKFHLYLLDEKMQVLADLPFRYDVIGQGALRWYDLDVPAIEVPANFSIGLDFRPDAEKAIHLGLQRGVAQTHSFVGLPAKGYQKMAQPVEWMVRVVVADQKGGTR